MNNEMNRREFLDIAAKAGCGCAMAAGLAGCTEPAGQSRRQKESLPAAFCGLYCGGCPLYQMSINAPDSSQIKCLGCKSSRLADHCAQCAIRPCATGKNLSSCGQCSQFPCEKTKKFHSNGMDMAVVAEKNCFQVRKKGFDFWLRGQPARWTCQKCGSSFSFQDEICPRCKADVYSCKEEAADYRRGQT
jgi:hypothetical protein